LTGNGAKSRYRTPQEGADWQGTKIDNVVESFEPKYDSADFDPMPERPRLYETMLREHLAEHRQMALVREPRANNERGEKDEI
jgi:hypothetical protein